MTETTTIKILPEYVAGHLGAPFNVVLINSVKETKNEQGKVIKTTIPNPRGLLRQVAVTRLAHPRKLNGKDIKFIRKALAVKAKDLADMISVSPEHISRCEADKTLLAPGTEKFLRMTLLINELKLPDGLEECVGNDPVLRRKISNFNKLLKRLQVGVTDMQIENAYAVDTPLTLHFLVSNQTSDENLNKDEVWEDDLELAA